MWKKETLKNSRNKQEQVTYKWIKIRLSEDFLSGTWITEDDGAMHPKILRENDFQPSILYLASQDRV